MLTAEPTMFYVVNNLNQALDQQNSTKAKMDNKKLYRILNQNKRCVGVVSQHEQLHRTVAAIKQFPLFILLTTAVIFTLISHFLISMDALEFSLRKSVIFKKQEST